MVCTRWSSTPTPSNGTCSRNTFHWNHQQNHRCDLQIHNFFPCSKEEVSSKTTTTLVEKALFYIPGLYVDYRSYSRLAQALADKHNVLVVLMNSEPIRISLPVFGFDTAYMTSIIDEVETDWNLQVKEWSIGGHSLGTIASSNMSLDSDFPKKIKKVVMHAGFWNPDKSLESSPLKFLILNATNDGFYFDSDQAKQNYLSCYYEWRRPNGLHGNGRRKSQWLRRLRTPPSIHKGRR